MNDFEDIDNGDKKGGVFLMTQPLMQKASIPRPGPRTKIEHDDHDNTDEGEEDEVYTRSKSVIRSALESEHMAENSGISARSIYSDSFLRQTCSD